MTHIDTEPTLLEVLDMMDRYAGSFVKALAEAWRRADLNNQQRLMSTFKDYYDQYADMVKMEKARKAGGS